MAKEYLEKLSKLLIELKIEESVDVPLETKHFFSGAALYAKGEICASWSPVGLAFKLPATEVRRLIESGEAKPLQYFEKSPIKKDYAVFEHPNLSISNQWKLYFMKAIAQNKSSEGK